MTTMSVSLGSGFLDPAWGDCVAVAAGRTLCLETALWDLMVRIGPILRAIVSSFLGLKALTAREAQNSFYNCLFLSNDKVVSETELEPHV